MGVDSRQELVQFPATFRYFTLAEDGVKNYKTNLQLCYFVAKSSSQRVEKTFQLPRNGNFRTRSGADFALAQPLLPCVPPPATIVWLSVLQLWPGATVTVTWLKGGQQFG